MPISLNTGHALYANLTSFVAVDDDNAVKDLVTPARTFTPAASVSISSGALGRHAALGGTNKYITVSPGIPWSRSVTETVVIVANSYGTSAGRERLFTPTNSFLRVANATGLVSSANSYASPNPIQTATTGVKDAAPHLIALTRNSATSHKIYIDAAKEVDSATASGFSSAGGEITSLGGSSADYAAHDLVYLMTFNVELSDAQVAEIHGSLGAGNAISLLSSGATNGSVTGGTGTGTGSGTGGDATGVTAGNGSVTGGTGAGTGSGSGGDATGTSGTGSITVGPLENSPGSLWLSQSVAWTWAPLGRVGSMTGITFVEGSGTTHATTGELTVSGLAVGEGELRVVKLGATALDDLHYVEYGTVA